VRPSRTPTAVSAAASLAPRPQPRADARDQRVRCLAALACPAGHQRIDIEFADEIPDLGRKLADPTTLVITAGMSLAARSR
jgi:hypothetical protein